MYCSSCGAAVAGNLSYCNQCGANLIGAGRTGVTKPGGLAPDSLVWAIVGVFTVGLGCIIGLMAVMKDYHFEQGLIIAFSLLIFLLMLAIEGVFFWLLLGRKGGATEMSDARRLPDQVTRELGAAQERTLPDPLPSVTDHTTRAFEPIFGKRKAE